MLGKRKEIPSEEVESTVCDDDSEFDFNSDYEQSLDDDDILSPSIQSSKYGESLYQEHLTHLKQTYSGISVDGDAITLQVGSLCINIYVFAIDEYPRNHSFCPEFDSDSVASIVSHHVTEKFSNATGPIMDYVQSLTSYLETYTNDTFKSSTTTGGTLFYEYFSLSEFMERTETSRELCDAWGLSEADNIIVGYSTQSQAYVRTCPENLLSDLTIRSVNKLPMFALSLIVEDDFKRNFKSLHQQLLQQKSKDLYSWVSLRIPGIQGPLCPIYDTSIIELFAIDFCLARIASTHLFCSICHDPVDLTAMAFKPFVCSKDLCFMQLVEFGFGTPLEHVIQQSPHELDLLLSLAYIATRLPRLPSEWTLNSVRSAIDSIPSITELKSQLESEPSLTLKDILARDSIKVMRYVLAVNRSYIKVCKPEERLTHLDTWQQFHIRMTNPQNEKIFQAIKSEVNQRVKSLYAYHGSDAANWFSILATGLNFDTVVNGRAYGNGIYMSRYLETSRGYCRKPNLMWKNSGLTCGSVLSVNEVVNLPTQFVHVNPHFVVDKPDWVQTRYLLFESGDSQSSTATKFLAQDKTYPLNGVNIPEPLRGTVQVHTPVKAESRDLGDLMQPTFASATATKALFKELKRMIKLQQDKENTFWKLELDDMNSLYKWNVTLFGFDAKFLLSKDLKKHKLRGINLEIYFGPEFPFLPPFVRVVTPRFVPFSQGGGGHVTAGGSICMDLLTTDGWSPSYTVEAILMQVYLALSSVDPRPARIQTPVSAYSIMEALEAYERVAQTHGWSINKKFREFVL